MSPIKSFSQIVAASALFAVGSAYAAAPLALEVYNPGTNAIFPVSSTIITGERDAVLVDAQFGKAQAEQVVAKIRASGKNLTTIYISHGDPDFYFGLETIKAAFPQAKVVATASTVEHIQQTAAGKLAFWGPKLGADAPSKVIMPDVLQGHSIQLEGQTLEVLGLNDKQTERSFVWIPSIKAVLGSIVVFNNQHVWMADTQSAQSHADWLATLARIESLKPQTVVPGHDLPGAVSGPAAVSYTAGYIKAFDQETAKAKNGDALIAALKARYPQAGAEPSLHLSAKVAKGEMKW